MEVAVATRATTSAHVVEAEGVEASATAREVMPASNEDDIRRIHHNLDVEKAVVWKRSANERLTVARSSAYTRVDFGQVARCHAQAACRQETKRAASRCRKARRAVARVEVAKMERDPRSGGN